MIDLKRIEENLKVIPAKSTVIIGCSGGADSTFLTYICAKLLSAQKTTVVLAHINHNLRAKESQKDEEFVIGLGAQLKLKVEVESAHFAQFTEEKGRKARFAFFEKCLKKHKAKYILLAHHSDDNTETILMNFTRGTGLTGLQGIKLQKKCILRPLLHLSKQEILDYLKKHKIKYREDASNLNNEYTRNFYRNQVIPLLKEKNPQLNQNLQKNAQNFAEIEDFMQETAQNWLKTNLKGTSYDIKSFRLQKPALQKEILRQLHKKTMGHLQELESKHLQEILEFLTNSHSGKRKNLGKWVEISIKDKTFNISALRP